VSWILYVEGVVVEFQFWNWFFDVVIERRESQARGRRGGFLYSWRVEKEPEVNESLANIWFSTGRLHWKSKL